MNRRPRNYIPHLSAEYARQFPHRPEKILFTDEILVAVAFIMRQIDPDGRRPIIEPPVYLEGAEPQLTAKSSGKRGKTHE